MQRSKYCQYCQFPYKIPPKEEFCARNLPSRIFLSGNISGYSENRMHMWWNRKWRFLLKVEIFPQEIRRQFFDKHVSCALPDVCLFWIQHVYHIIAIKKKPTAIWRGRETWLQENSFVPPETLFLDSVNSKFHLSKEMNMRISLIRRKQERISSRTAVGFQIFIIVERCTRSCYLHNFDVWISIYSVYFLALCIAQTLTQVFPSSHCHVENIDMCLFDVVICMMTSGLTWPW